MRIEICGLSKCFLFSLKTIQINKLNYFYYDVIDCHYTLTHKSFRNVLLKSPIPQSFFDMSIARITWHIQMKMLFYYNSFLSSSVSR
jgi:hypothetical protein